MKLSHALPTAVMVLLCACSAPKQAAAPDVPGKGAAPAGASAPEATATDGAAPGENKKAEAPALAGGAPAPEARSVKPTSPTNEAGPDGDSANPPAATKRLEDYKATKNSGSGGSYSVAVRSAAGLVPNEVGKAVDGAATKMDACYSKVAKKKPAAGSATLFEVNVNDKGSGSIKLLNDALKDGDWTKCLESALKGISWPKPTEKTGKTTIEFTVGG